MSASIEAVYYPEERTWQSHLVQSHRRKQQVVNGKALGIEHLVPWEYTIQINNSEFTVSFQRDL